MIDRYPALIVRPRGAADVMAALAFAREQGLEIALKGGGHNVAGNAVCERGLMLDLSAMTSARVNPAKRTVRVEPGGEIARRLADPTPYPHRDAGGVLNIQSRWRDAAEDARHIAWARETFDAVAPFTTGGVYVHFISGDEGTARVRAAYGDRAYERLTALKGEWDPDNRFHLNQNIAPLKAAMA